MCAHTFMCACACTCEHACVQMYSCRERQEKSIRYLGGGVKGICECTVWCEFQELNSDPPDRAARFLNHQAIFPAVLCSWHINFLLIPTCEYLYTFLIQHLKIIRSVMWRKKEYVILILVFSCQNEVRKEIKLLSVGHSWMEQRLDTSIYTPVDPGVKTVMIMIISFAFGYYSTEHLSWSPYKW